MDVNGNDATAQLRAEVAELRDALELLTRHLENDWRPRLLAVERDVDALARELARGAGG